MTVRLRFALLYSGAFLLSGLLVLTVAFASVEQVQHVGGGPVRTFHPSVYDNVSVTQVAVGLGALVVLSVGFGWLLASRLLRPVRAITETARDISASNLSRRLPLGHRDDEFSQLGETLNGLFERLEDSFTAQRHFVANASHELRTPLTAERTLLQVALADPDAPALVLREACEQVLALGLRTERLIDGLLTLATGERGIQRREPLDLAAIAVKVTESKTGIQLDLDIERAPASGDPSLAESLIANLVDNAIRYNVPGGWVAVRTGQRDGRSVVSVSNSGPVVPAEDVGRLFEPFQRLGASRVHGRGDGHGLGLAIVGAIADAHGATVTARARDTGGLDVEVSFPGR
ncbi:MAG: ATP-binding protein [Streptosporangiaceae bacterium]|jgi:signal transduction histidine kinase